MPLHLIVPLTDSLFLSWLTFSRHETVFCFCDHPTHLHDAHTYIAPSPPILLVNSCKVCLNLLISPTTSFFLCSPNLPNSNQFSYPNLIPNASNQHAAQYRVSEGQVKQEFASYSPQRAVPNQTAEAKYKPVKSEESFSDSYESSSDFRENPSSPELDLKHRTSTPSTSAPEDLSLSSLSSSSISSVHGPRPLPIGAHSGNPYPSNMNSSHHAMSAYLKSNPYAMNGIAGITSAGDLLHSSVGYPGKYLTLLEHSLHSIARARTLGVSALSLSRPCFFPLRCSSVRPYC